VSVGRLSTGHGGGTSTSQVIGRLHVCRAADTVTDWRQKLHGSWTTRDCRTICRSNFDSETQVLNNARLLKTVLFDWDCGALRLFFVKLRRL